MTHDVPTPRLDIRPPRAGFRRPAHLSAATLEPRSAPRDRVVAFGDTAGLLPLATALSGDVLLVADGRSAGADAITAEARSRRIPVVVSGRPAPPDLTHLDVLERRSCTRSATGPPLCG